MKLAWTQRGARILIKFLFFQKRHFLFLTSNNTGTSISLPHCSHKSVSTLVKRTVAERPNSYFQDRRKKKCPFREDKIIQSLTNLSGVSRMHRRGFVQTAENLP